MTLNEKHRLWCYFNGGALFAQGTFLLYFFIQSLGITLKYSKMELQDGAQSLTVGVSFILEVCMENAYNVLIVVPWLTTGARQLFYNTSMVLNPPADRQLDQPIGSPPVSLCSLTGEHAGCVLTYTVRLSFLLPVARYCRCGGERRQPDRRDQAEDQNEGVPELGPATLPDHLHCSANTQVFITSPWMQTQTATEERKQNIQHREIVTDG